MADDDGPVDVVEVLTASAVRWGIETLGSRKIHPTFIFYLYLRKKHVEGMLDEASSSSGELKELLRMPGGPTGKPYYRPLRERGDRTGELLKSFWMADNIAGSWSQRSLMRQTASAWLVDAASNYTIPPDHAERARTNMLYGSRVSALAMGAYFLRNDGFQISGTGTSDDVVAGFRKKFRFDDVHDDEFNALFEEQGEQPSLGWFEIEIIPTRGDGQ